MAIFNLTIQQKRVFETSRRELLNGPTYVVATPADRIASNVTYSTGVPIVADSNVTYSTASFSRNEWQDASYLQGWTTTFSVYLYSAKTKTPKINWKSEGF